MEWCLPATTDYIPGECDFSSSHCLLSACNEPLATQNSGRCLWSGQLRNRSYCSAFSMIVT